MRAVWRITNNHAKHIRKPIELYAGGVGAIYSHTNNTVVFEYQDHHTRPPSMRSITFKKEQTAKKFMNWCTLAYLTFPPLSETNAYSENSSKLKD